MPTADQIAEMHRHVRTCLTALAGAAGAGIRILYGGSVTADNANEVLGLADVGGVLIGGASLLAADFDAVLRCVPDQQQDATASGWPQPEAVRVRTNPAPASA